MSKNSKPHLSKGILQMKFMQRTKEKIDEENDASVGRAMYAKEISQKMKNSISNFIVESSYVYCEGLSEGRFSFRGMNPEIERLLELEQAEREAAKERVQKTEVSDKEMVDFYNKNQAPATVTMERKFQHKKQQIKRNSTQQTETDSKRKKLQKTDVKNKVKCES